ncbi:MAG: IS481 family transposase, partial [Candidatus Eisenbacteria sp.]|nr:IS481 family transposase [Candidatus Eisenbacteria bacterium]
MSTKEVGKRLERWAHLRFSIIGGLLASPPERGKLRAELQRLAGQRYRHPSRPGGWVSFGVSTLERWYYRAVRAADPMKALGRRVRRDVGR